jgi:hypothetical protein
MAASSEDFVKRLDTLSERGGIPYGRAQLLFDEECKYGELVLQYKDHLALSEAFECFFLETVEPINRELQPRAEPSLSVSYALFVPRLVFSFQSLHGAEIVAFRGYPHQGYILLRKAFDNLVLMSAALQGFADFHSLEGIPPERPFDFEAVRSSRMSTERAVYRKMTGDESGLTPETILDSARWDVMFDFEPHGARLSLAQTSAWLKGTAPLQIVPTFDDAMIAMFMNRYCEVCWMTHRLLPLVQLPGVSLPDTWREKWRVIDESFQQMVESLTERLGKTIGAAIVELVKTKFPFNERTCYPQ